MRENKIFITRNILQDGPNLLKMKGLAVEIFPHDYPIDKKTLYEKSKTASALICMLSDIIDLDFLSANSHLKVISNYAVGFNNIDIAAASTLKIPIGNTPDVLTNATAELTIGLMIATSRHFFNSACAVRNGDWKDWNPTAFLGPELNNKTLGIIGMGRIGKRVSQIASMGFKMKILDSSQNKLDEILCNSDFISLHVPLNDNTKGMIGMRELKMMKPTAILINTARGEIINQNDLILALENKIIWGAGLDVATPEPLPVDSKLLKLTNVFITPHIGSGSLEARKEMSLIAAQNILLGLNKERLVGFVNPQVYNH
jgi:glyoxylate reductase